MHESGAGRRMRRAAGVRGARQSLVRRCRSTTRGAEGALVTGVKRSMAFFVTRTAETTGALKTDYLNRL